VADSARTVLVADDSPVARAVLRKILVAAGFAILEAASLGETRSLDSGTALFAAVLDLDLGDGTGLEAARSLASSHPTLPFVFFTSEGDAPLADAARALAPVFIKPRECDRVLAWLENL